MHLLDPRPGIIISFAVACMGGCVYEMWVMQSGFGNRKLRCRKFLESEKLLRVLIYCGPACRQLQLGKDVVLVGS